MEISGPSFAHWIRFVTCCYGNNNEWSWSKNLDERLRCKEVRFFYGQQCHAVIENWMIPLLRTLQQRLPVLLQNCTFSFGGLVPYLVHTWVRPPPQTAYQSVQPFLHNSPVCPINTRTHTQTTLHVTSVAIGCIYILRVMRPNSNDEPNNNNKNNKA